MIVIDRQNSNGLWAFKLVDGNEIKISVTNSDDENSNMLVIQTVPSLIMFKLFIFQLLR